jgi:LPS sulfotransferase NodH/transposase-like protein
VASDGQASGRKALIIASQVRSGSTFVAESIAYHFEGIFGDVLFDLTREHFAGLSDTSSHEQILTLFNSLYLGHQGWIATKIMCAALSVIVRESRKADSLNDAFFGPNTYWIIVRRRETVGQAVSLAYAREIGDWHVYKTTQKAAEQDKVTLKETEEALRSVLLSDVYLESFKHFISADSVIEIYYEDFLCDPTPFIERIYGVLGLVRPEGGVRYVDKTKIRRHATNAKQQVARDFKAWLLENYHAVKKPEEAGSSVRGEPAQPASPAEVKYDLQVEIVQEFIHNKRSIRFLSEKYRIERALINYWIAKHRHGELEDGSRHAEELSCLRARVAALQSQVEQLSLRAAIAALEDDHA